MLFQATSLPTFVILKDKKKLDSMSGANKAALESKIITYYQDSSREDSGVKGMVSSVQNCLQKDLEIVV